MDTLLTAAFAALLWVLLATLLAFVIAAPVMWLWNAVVPEISHLKAITWVQALYLTLLCALLFGSGQKVRIK